MEDHKESGKASFEQLQPDPSPERATKKLNPPRTKTRQAIKNLNLDSTVKEKDLLDPFMKKFIELNEEIGFVSAIKKLQHRIRDNRGFFSIQEWYQVYQGTRPGTKLNKMALKTMHQLYFDARTLEDAKILYSIAEPNSWLRKDMEERMSRIK